MFIVTRKSQQSVVVGRADDAQPVLKVTVLEITNGRVRLGFEGTSTVPIHRTEVWQRIRAENEVDALAIDASVPNGW
ncbi:MAG: carbon storage regulator [Planctomycetia bacterium]|nr:carbon storage regulator [Planctomycetia bacterium]